MPSFSDEMHIESPAATVFDLFVDLRNELKWNAGVKRAELLTDPPIGKGSRFLVEDKRGTHETIITVFERPHHVELALSSKDMDVDITYAFTEADGTTTAAGHFSAEPKGFMKVLLPLLMPLIKRDIAKQHASFKELCEQQST